MQAIQADYTLFWPLFKLLEEFLSEEFSKASRSQSALWLWLHALIAELVANLSGIYSHLELIFSSAFNQAIY